MQLSLTTSKFQHSQNWPYHILSEELTIDTCAKVQDPNPQGPSSKIQCYSNPLFPQPQRCQLLPQLFYLGNLMLF
jgi:hypothetical protein